MTLKIYRAQSMADALAEVKRDLGTEAVILHTRQYRLGGVLGLGRRSVVEITASAGTVTPVPIRRPLRRASAGASKPQTRPSSRDASSSAGVGVLDRPEPVAVGDAADRASAGSGASTEARAIRRQSGADGRGRRLEPRDRAIRTGFVQTPQAAGSGIEQELSAIRRMVAKVLESSNQSALLASREGGSAAPVGVGMTDALLKHYLRLVEVEVAGEIVEEVIGKVRDELTPGELADEAIVRETVLRHLASMIPEAGDVPAPERTDDGRPRTISLVGPTGVGKTTTVAKLAAAYKLRHGKSVGLIAGDTYRIGAVDQLRSYAEIINVPIRVTLTPAEMSDACRVLRRCDVILIDTAGRSHNDSRRLEELRALIEAAHPHETHLVLSSAADRGVLLRSAERFAVMRPNRVILTKLDEAANYGVLLTVARRIDAALSFVTTGQEVPDHIEPGQSERLARLVLDGELIR